MASRDLASSVPSGSDMTVANRLCSATGVWKAAMTCFDMVIFLMTSEAICEMVSHAYSEVGKKQDMIKKHMLSCVNSAARERQEAGFMQLSFHLLSHILIDMGEMQRQAGASWQDSPSSFVF